MTFLAHLLTLDMTFNFVVNYIVDFLLEKRKNVMQAVNHFFVIVSLIFYDYLEAP